MALRISVLLLRPRFCSWRRVERGWMRCHSGGAHHASSERGEDEWTLDLDVDPEEVNHAPHEEPHPQDSAHRTGAVRRTATTRADRLLFSVGKQWITADQFVRKTSRNESVGHLAMGSTDFEDCAVPSGDSVEYDGGDREEGWWGGREGGEGSVVESDGDIREEARVVKGDREIEEEGRVVKSDGVKKASGKNRTFLNMREMRKFLRGKALAGSRLATPPPESADLLQCLEDKLQPCAAHMDVFSTVPSVLGSSVGSVEERIGRLRRIGFTQHEVETLLLAFPPILEVDFKNVYAVCKVLRQYITGGHILRGLLMKHPFLFLQPAKQIEERVTVLRDICQDIFALGFLLHNFPILLLAPLTPSTLHTITKYTTSQDDIITEGRQHYSIGHSWVAKSLYHNLSAFPARVEPGRDMPALIDLLAEFQLEPTPIFIKFPGFFKASYAHVASLLEVLTGGPLYLDTFAIRTLLCSIPDQLVWTEDTEQLRTHLESLAQLFSSVKECSEKVVSWPGLALPQLGLREWLEALEGVAFTRSQIVQLVSGMPNILLQNRREEFMPRLKLLLSVTGTTPSHIMACTVKSRVDIFSTPINVLTVRLMYATKRKPDKVSAGHIAEIFASREREFAAFCECSVDQLRSETGLFGVELKRFKSRRKATKKPGVLGSIPLTTKPQDPSIEDKSDSVVNTEHSPSRTLTSARTNSQVTKKTLTEDTYAPVTSELKRNNGLSYRTALKGDKKKSRETKKVATKRVQKDKHSPSSDAHVESVSTTSHPTGAAKLLDKQSTANAPKTNATDTTQGKKIYARKCLKETRAKQAC